MEDEVEIERSEVQECRYQSPVLALVEDGAEAVEEVEGADDVALHEDAGHYCGRRPVSCAYGHLEEPLLQRELSAHAAVASAQDRSHRRRWTSE